jgi:hypothetical protein
MNIEQDISDIKNRNKHVEDDKAWEVSKTRRFCIAFITYLVAAYYMRVLGVETYYFHAFVPTGGYLLSTLALPTLKCFWLKRKN